MHVHTAPTRATCEILARKPPAGRMGARLADSVANLDDDDSCVQALLEAGFRGTDIQAGLEEARILAETLRPKKMPGGAFRLAEAVAAPLTLAAIALFTALPSPATAGSIVQPLVSAAEAGPAPTWAGNALLAAGFVIGLVALVSIYAIAIGIAGARAARRQLNDDLWDPADGDIPGPVPAGGGADCTLPRPPKR